MPFDLEQLHRFPTISGVYLMKNHEGKILYIGKAKNLRQRVKQYFVPGRDGRAIVPYLTAQIESIETILVTSEKEALILENTLIKKHQPKYNALLKDDKTYFNLAINHKHPWPMLRVVRLKGKPPPDALYFGPYTHGHAARQTLELLRHLFPLRQCSDHELVSRTRPCILYDLKRCIAPCCQKCTKEEYDILVGRVVHFLRGQDSLIIKELEEELEKAVENLEFEKADSLYRKINHIKQTLQQQRVDKAGSEDLDVIHIYREAEDALVMQMIFREGKLVGARDHPFSHNAQDNEELLSSFILQHYGHLDLLPHEILIPMELQEQETLAALISADKKRKTEILCPKKGNKKALIEMALANAKARFERDKQEQHQKEKILFEMEEKFQLTNYPERIECFDHSNISGTEPVSAMVVYTQGEKDPKAYRKYKIREAEPSDDYGCLREVLTRRYGRAKEEDNLPDLILIDGGKGHLNIATNILEELDISTVDVIAIAKEDAKHTKSMTAEKVFLPGKLEPLLLPTHSPLLFFLQQIRDETHRFAISFHRQRRNKRSLKVALDDLPGIGPVKKQRLLQTFGSFKRIVEASSEELLKVPGITRKDVETIKKSKKTNEI